MTILRVLHCPERTGGHSSSLARAERELGLKSWAISYRHDVYIYPVDEVLLESSFGPFSYFKAMMKLFLKAMNYDVIHYNFGQTIFPARIQTMKPVSSIAKYLVKFYYYFFHMIDLKIFHLMRKCIAVTFQGDDARQGDFSKENFAISIADHVDPGYYSPSSDAEKRQVIATYDHYAHLIYYVNPDLGHVLPNRAKFMPTPRIDMRTWKPVPKERSTRPVVVHAPSHRGVKGTEVVLNVTEKLKNEGLDFDFILVEGLPNSEARKIYERADLLIDQLYAGWYGGLAVELMALGKPVMCYIRESDLIFIPEKMQKDLPIINVRPDTLYSALTEWLVERRDELPALGMRCRTFVEEWHDPLKIAAKLQDDYMDVWKRIHASDK
jgi:hypothetical protein